MVEEKCHLREETDVGQVPVHTPYILIAQRAHLELLSAVTYLLTKIKTGMNLIFRYIYLDRYLKLYIITENVSNTFRYSFPCI